MPAIDPTTLRWWSVKIGFLLPILVKESIDWRMQSWLHTGDAGYVDDEGFLYLVDRIKDMIILDNFPRNVAGKTLKREIIEIYLEDRI